MTRKKRKRYGRRKETLALEDKRNMEQEIFRLNNLIIKKDEKIIEQHNLLCEHGLAEYGN